MIVRLVAGKSLRCQEAKLDPAKPSWVRKSILRSTRQAFRRIQIRLLLNGRTVRHYPCRSATTALRSDCAMAAAHAVLTLETAASGQLMISFASILRNRSSGCFRISFGKISSNIFQNLIKIKKALPCGVRLFSYLNICSRNDLKFLCFR